MKPMLATNVDPMTIVSHAQDRNYVFQQKLDGIRILIVVNDGRVQALNRRGEPSVTELPKAVIAQLKTLPRASMVMLDGELVDNTLWLFDFACPGIAGLDASFDERYTALSATYKLWKPAKCIRLLPVARSSATKLRLSQRVLVNNGEGVIIRDRRAGYKPGVRGPAVFKAKFVKDVDCVVTELGRFGRSNLGLGLWDENGELRDVGEVTANAAEGKLAKVNDVVTVRYLYSTETFRLYQPNMPRLRNDKKPKECTLDQLKIGDKTVLTKW